MVGRPMLFSPVEIPRNVRIEVLLVIFAYIHTEKDPSAYDRCRLFMNKYLFMSYHDREIPL